MKDNQIAELVNRLRDNLKPLCKHECLRERISGVCITFFKEIKEENGERKR